MSSAFRTLKELHDQEHETEDDERSLYYSAQEGTGTLSSRTSSLNTLHFVKEEEDDGEDDEDDEDGEDDEADEAEEADEAHHPVSPTVWRGVDENSSQNPKTAPRPSRSTIPRLVWTEPSANKPVNSCATSIMDQWVIFSPKKTGREPPRCLFPFIPIQC